MFRRKKIRSPKFIYTRKGPRLADLEMNRNRRVELLSQWSDVSKARLLAEVMERCEQVRRCRSVFCPLCADAAKRCLTAHTSTLTRNLLAAFARESNWRSRLMPKSPKKSITRKKDGATELRLVKTDVTEPIQ